MATKNPRQKVRIVKELQVRKFDEINLEQYLDMSARYDEVTCDGDRQQFVFYKFAQGVVRA